MAWFWVPCEMGPLKNVYYIITIDFVYVCLFEFKKGGLSYCDIKLYQRDTKLADTYI